MITKYGVIRKLKIAALGIYKPITAGIHYRNTDMFIDICIETLSGCNRKCSYCPVSKHPKPSVKMSCMEFCNLIDTLASIGYRHTISFTGYCEPLLDKRLLGFIAYARSRLPHCNIIVFTNGDYLTDKYRYGLQNLRVNIVVSRHDTMRKGESFYNRGGLVNVDNCMKGATSCIQPTFRCFVFATGNVVICCNDYNEEVVLGNIKDTSIVDIWKDSRAFRGIIAKGEFVDLCKRCIEGDTDG